MITPYQPTRSDRLLCYFLQMRKRLQPQQLRLALKVQQNTYGPLDMILWQLGFITSQELSAFWTFREQAFVSSSV